MKTEVGKGSMPTVIEHGLARAKWLGNSVKRVQFGLFGGRSLVTT